MSLICHEDGRGLYVADEASAVTTVVAATFSAVCSLHLRDVPPVERFPEPVEGGLDVHYLFGRPNTYSADPTVDTLSFTRGLEFGDYRFSIRPALARLVLPRCFALYVGHG